MRINKYLAEHGICSRREADRLIESGRVVINGKRASLGDQVDENSAVLVDNQLVAEDIKKFYLAYNKPVKIEVTANTNVAKNLKDALNFDTHVFPIGRLDKDSSGLLLLTNDGGIVNKILRPEHNHEKEYLVHVDKPVTSALLQGLVDGVKLDGVLTSPAVAWKQNDHAFKLVITEGKNRQIRRMCANLGFEVRALKRVRIMNIKLGKLKPGEWRHLSKQEKRELFRSLD